MSKKNSNNDGTNDELKSLLQQLKNCAKSLENATKSIEEVMQSNDAKLKVHEKPKKVTQENKCKITVMPDYCLDDNGLITDIEFTIVKE